MPEDKYGFKATPAQRSFGEHVLHVAQINVMLLQTVGVQGTRPANRHEGDVEGRRP